MTEAAPIPRSRRPLPLLFDDSSRAFTARVVVICALVLAGSWATSLLGLPGAARFAVTAIGALVLALAFLRRPAEALLSFSLLILFYDTISIHIGGPFRQLDELALACFGVIAFIRIAPSWRSWVWLPRELAIVVAVVAGVVSSLAAAVPLETWGPGLLLSMKSVLFFYVVMWTPFRRWEVVGTLRTIVGLAAIVLLLSFVEFVAPRSVQAAFGLPAYDVVRAGIPVVKSVFTHPVLFAWFTSFAALLAFSHFSTSRRWGWLVLGVLFSTGPFLAVRRRAILALLAGLAAGFVESLRRIKGLREIARAWLPVAAGLALIVSIFAWGIVGMVQLTVDRYLPSIGEPLPTPVAGEDVDEADEIGENPQARVALYQGSVAIARDFLPLGGGYGRFGSWMSRVDYSPLYEEYGLSKIHGLRPSNPSFATDTFWPQVLGETGVVGVMGYAAFLGTVVFMLWREAARDDGSDYRVLRVAAGMVFAQALLESLASAMFNSPPRMYLLYLSVGMVASLAWRPSSGALLDDAGMQGA